MSAFLTICLCAPADLEIAAFIATWRRIDSAVVDAAIVSDAIHSSSERFPPERVNEGWLVDKLAEIQPTKSALVLRLQAPRSLLNGSQFELIFHGKEFDGGWARRLDGPFKADLNYTALTGTLSEEQMPTCDAMPAIGEVLRLFRLAVGWRQGEPSLDQACLAGEGGWESPFTSLATYFSNTRQLPSAFLQLHLEMYHRIHLPETLQMAGRGEKWPKSSGRVNKDMRRYLRSLSKAGDFLAFVEQFDLQKATRLAAMPPELVWDVLVNISADNPRWTLERAGDSLLITSDAESRWPLFLQAAKILC